MNANYADDLALLTISTVLEQVTRGINLYVNSDKTESRWDHSILDGKTLKLVDEFEYFGSNIESDVNRCMGKTWLLVS